MNLKKWIPVLLIFSVLFSGCLDTFVTDMQKMQIQDLKFYTNLTAALDKANSTSAVFAHSPSDSFSNATTSFTNSTGQPVFVYFRSDTCGWCKKFEEESFTNKTIVGILQNNFTIVTIDVYKQRNITRLYGVRGTPHEIFLYPNGTEINRLPGYVDNQTFLNTINEIVLLTRGQKNEI
ncbi:Thiol:disulfide interchange protein DsbD [uncultured archaeon]|nr:Thiol:disulfide interchange protein DsbD [uncultured archaeon]